MSAPPSGRGSTHNLQLDIMDDIADLKARKVRLRMYRTSTEQVYEIQPLEGNSSAQRYTQQPKQRFSGMPTPSVSPTSSLRKRVSELPRAVSGAAGIVCSNTDLISILSSLASSATEINRCGEEAPSSQDDSKSNWPGKTTEQKGSRSKSFRSNSFDVSTLHGAKSKLSGSSKAAISTFMAPSNWFTKRHQPKKPEDLVTASLSLKFDKSKVVKAVKETLGKKSPNSEVKHKVVWDNTSGTKVDAQLSCISRYDIVSCLRAIVGERRNEKENRKS